MPLGSEAIIISFPSSLLELSPLGKETELSGVSEKGIYQNKEGERFYVKEPKLRKTTEIFKNDPFFNELLYRRWKVLRGEFSAAVELNDETLDRVKLLSEDERLLFDRIQEKLWAYEQHVQELVLTNTVLEVLVSRISSAVMGDLLVAPQDCLYIHQGIPLIISPSVGLLKEFLAENPLTKNVKNPEFWLSHPTPRFEDLVTTEEQARLLGQAYFIALLFSHYDVVNNINLSNSGYIQVDDRLVLSIVDWGNALGVGFSGLTADESAFKNLEFAGTNTPLLENKEITGFNHVQPFDKVVYPLLPRQIVENLFDLTADDHPHLRSAQRQGFYEACERAFASLDNLYELIPLTIQHTLYKAMTREDAQRVIPLLPSFVSNEIRGIKNPENLSNVISARINSLVQIKAAIQAGVKLEDIAKARLKVIINSQLSPGLFSSSKAVFFSPETKYESTPSRPKHNRKESPRPIG